MRPLIIVLTGALAFGLALVPRTVDAHGGDSAKIHSCVNNSSGEIKIVAPNASCKQNETALDWSKAAPGAGGAVDTTPPGVTLGPVPAHGFVGDCLGVPLQVSDNTGVAFAQLFLGGQFSTGWTNPPSTFTVCSDQVGPQQFTVLASDFAGNIGSASATIQSV